jgi:hypothetical protein
MSLSNFDLCTLTPPDRKVVVPDVCWDTKSGTLFAAKLEGEVAVYSSNILDNFNSFPSQNVTLA